MNKIRNIIIVILIILLILMCILIPLIINGKQKKEEEDFEQLYKESQANTEYLLNYYENNKYITYFDTVKTCIRTFYNALNTELYYRRDDEGNFELPSNKEINENIMLYLSKEYIEQNNITSDNLNKYIKLFDKTQNIVILDIKSTSGEQADTFAVHCLVVNSDYELTEECYLYVFLDQENQTFEIEPITEKINDFSSFKITARDESIPNNGSNSFKYITLKIYDKVQGFIEQYKCLTLATPEKAYGYMDEAYREARFGTLSEFKKYVANNKDFIKNIRAVSYLTEDKNGCTDYVIKDQYDNLYIFSEKSVLDYTVKLDTYTLSTEKFKTSYKTMSNQDRVATNIDRFFQMLNSNDYKAAYSVLNEEFKNIYFPTVDSFEKFMKENTYTHADVRYINYSDEISGIYTYRIELSNKENKDDKKIIMNIIMKLQEGTDYTISFEVLK